MSSKTINVFDSRFIGCNPTAVIFKTANEKYPTNNVDSVVIATSAEATGGNTEITSVGHGLVLGDWLNVGRVIRVIDADTFIVNKAWNGVSSISYQKIYYGYQQLLEVYDSNDVLVGTSLGSPNKDNITIFDVGQILRNRSRVFPFYVRNKERYLVSNGNNGYDYQIVSVDAGIEFSGMNVLFDSNYLTAPFGTEFRSDSFYLPNLETIIASGDDYKLVVVWEVLGYEKNVSLRNVYNDVQVQTATANGIYTYEIDLNIVPLPIQRLYDFEISDQTAGGTTQIRLIEFYVLYKGQKIGLTTTPYFYYAVNGSVQPQNAYAQNMGNYVVNSSFKGKALTLFNEIPKFSGIPANISLLVEPNELDVITFEDSNSNSITIFNKGVDIYDIEFEFELAEWVVLKFNGVEVSPRYKVKNYTDCNSTCFLEWQNHLSGFDRFVFQGAKDLEHDISEIDNAKVWIDDNYAGATVENYQSELDSRLSYRFYTNNLNSNEIFAISEIQRSTKVYLYCKEFDECGVFVGYSKKEVIPERGNRLISKSNKRIFDFEIKVKDTFNYRSIKR